MQREIVDAEGFGAYWDGHFAEEDVFYGHVLGFKGLERSAVVLAVPPLFHHDMVMRALRAGKHVLCEKPFGLDAGQAAQMLDRSREAGTVCMVDYQFRMAPERMRLKELLEAGAIGRILRVNVEWTVRGRAAGNSAWSWQFDPSSGGGVLFAFGSHVVDYLQWLAGPARTVAAHLSRRGGPGTVVPGQLLRCFPGNMAEHTLQQTGGIRYPGTHQCLAGTLP